MTYEPTWRDRAGVHVLNALAHLLTSRAYREGIREMYLRGLHCKVHHDPSRVA